MDAIRKIVRADMLAPIIDVPWASENLEVEVIVLPLFEDTPRQTVSKKSLKGCLKAYANPVLWEKEQEAWETNIIEKHGHI